MSTSDPATANCHARASEDAVPAALPTASGLGSADGYGRALSVTVTGRQMHTTPVLDTYWRFAAERQRVYLSRLAGTGPLWTADSILARHRFTNCFRASDRVSQFLITQVVYRVAPDWEEIFFRTLLFRISTGFPPGGC